MIAYLDVVVLLAAQGHRNKFCLGGMPALQRCRLALHAAGSKHAVLDLDEDSFDSPWHSLEELMLRGVSRSIHVTNLGWDLIALPALRCLAIQNLGVTNLKWMEPSWNSAPAGPLHSLDLDDNADLQLDVEGAAALLNLTALKKLSMRKTPAPSNGSGIAGQADSAAAGAVWSADSVRCLTRLAAARPALKLCF